MLTGVAVVCSQTWPSDLLFHFLKSYSGPGSTGGPRCIYGGEAAGLSAVGGLAGQGHWRLETDGLLKSLWGWQSSVASSMLCTLLHSEVLMFLL